MIKYYAKQGFISEIYLDSKTKEEIIKVTRGKFRFLSKLKNLTNVHEKAEIDTYLMDDSINEIVDRIMSLHRHYDASEDEQSKKAYESSKEFLASVSVKSIGEFIMPPSDWISVGIVDRSENHLEEILKKACLKIIKENHTLLKEKLRKEYEMVLKIEKGIGFAHLLKFEIVMPSKMIVFPSYYRDQKFIEDNPIYFKANDIREMKVEEKQNLLDIKENVLIKFVENFPALDMFLYCYDNYFFIEASTDALFTKNMRYYDKL